MARTADVVIMMLDATKGEVQRSAVAYCLQNAGSPRLFFNIAVLFHRELLEKELETVGIRLNRPKPNIYFKVCGAILNR